MIEKYFRFQIHELSKYLYLYMVNESMIVKLRSRSRSGEGQVRVRKVKEKKRFGPELYPIFGFHHPPHTNFFLGMT